MTKKNEWPVIALAFTLLLSIFIITSFGFTTKIISLVAKDQKLTLEKNFLQKEKELLSQENEELNARISSADDPWLPDTLVFANLRIPLNDPENWYIKSKLREKVMKRLRPSANAGLIRVFRRIDYWFPYIERVADSLGFFEDVKWLCVQESWLDPIARSPANALGICQFKSETADDYGLNIHWPVDERLLPEKALIAKIKHMKDNYGEFGSIALALAAYNKGVDGLKGAIKRHQGPNPTFFNVEIETYRKYETEDFFYEIVSWKLVRENQDKYHINYEPGIFGEYPEVTLVDTTLTERYTDRSAVASYYGMGHPEFRELNPHILNRKLPQGAYTFRIPKYIFQEK